MGEVGGRSGEGPTTLTDQRSPATIPMKRRARKGRWHRLELAPRRHQKAQQLFTIPENNLRHRPSPDSNSQRHKDEKRNLFLSFSHFGKDLSSRTASSSPLARHCRFKAIQRMGGRERKQDTPSPLPARCRGNGALSVTSTGSTATIRTARALAMTVPLSSIAVQCGDPLSKRRGPEEGVVDGPSSHP